MASSSRAVVSRKHEVFLSFCGEDTRTTFLSTLHGALTRENIDVFIDDELNRGEEISSSLVTAIEESMISVIIFSEGYASSRWCLEELVKIMECKKTQKQVIIPVFYCIDPSEVRNQTGAFGDGFARLVGSFDEEKLKKLQLTGEKFKEKVEAWKDALRGAANISGRTSNRRTLNYNLAQKVIEDVLKILNFMSPSNNDKKLVGLELIIHKIESLLQIALPNVRTVGIWGMRGIGKTTIAKSVFDRISNRFEGSYFARNVREESASPYGLTPMRQELLFAILKDRIGFTKGRLGRRKVLIIFDDVTSLEQVEFLIENFDCLGSGSRIIITTTDKQVLRNCGVDDINICKIKGLHNNEALQLFSWYAFRQNRPNIGYEDLSKRVVKYTKGVPLALKVLGCCLLGKSKEVWESALKKFEIIPHKDIHKVLKISYDELNDDEQNIFLDIACFLKWQDKDFVVDFLNACDYEAEFGLSVLSDKCLITMTEDNKLTMHDLLQEMGWEIVRQESIQEPGKRSRLWYHKDVYSILEENKISNVIEGICLDMSKQGEIICLERSVLAKMDQLRFFKLHNALNEENDINKVHVSQELCYVSHKLRYLCWHGCPLKSLQSNIFSKNLVALDMPHSSIEELWPTVQLDRLKHVNLSYSKHLKIQDLSLAPNLESLILEGCTSLCEVVSSIYGLNYKLRILNLRHCKSLDSLPTDIHLQSLEKVIFSGCSNLKKFPQIFWNMKELCLDETAIEELSSSIENLSRLVLLDMKYCSKLERLPIDICELKSLEYLNLSGCSKLHGLPNNLGNLRALRVLKAERVITREVPTSILNLHWLEELDLTNCGIEELPNNLDQLFTLQSLRLGRNFFESIPTSIEGLVQLSYLDITYCERLKILPRLPKYLANIDANNCTKLEVLCSLFLPWFKEFAGSMRMNLSNCFKLELDSIYERAFQQWKTNDFFITNRYQKKSGCICFPGSEIPEWLVSQRVGSYITLDLQGDHHSSKLTTYLLLCAVVEFKNYHNEGEGLVVGFEYLFTREDGIMDVLHGTLRGWERGTGPDYVDSDHVFLGYDFPFYISGSNSIKDYKYCEITIRFYVENLITKREDFCKVKKCGAWSPVWQSRDEKPEFKDEKPEFKDEKLESKKLKTENFYVGESSTR
ncbi:disease resistance-like protein DSC1 [Mangifera indica]|uniref:disease resistance-like protein DSC1 n=1 Tax=Mangifera indica TaxID=29780 RepID=UPI001CF94C7B|nr:disease resistance-like protein DSC1 [Mangifera indica]